MSETPIDDWSVSADIGPFTVTQTGPSNGMTAVDLVLAVMTLRGKAQALVDLLEDAEVNHGGLVGTKTLTAKNVLRMELSRWK